VWVLGVPGPRARWRRLLRLHRHRDRQPRSGSL